VRLNGNEVSDRGVLQMVRWQLRNKHVRLRDLTCRACRLSYGDVTQEVFIFLLKSCGEKTIVSDMGVIDRATKWTMTRLLRKKRCPVVYLPNLKTEASIKPPDEFAPWLSEVAASLRSIDRDKFSRYLAGETLVSIAETYGVSKQQISLDLVRIRKLLKDRAMDAGIERFK